MTTSVYFTSRRRRRERNEDVVGIKPFREALCERFHRWKEKVISLCPPCTEREKDRQAHRRTDSGRRYERKAVVGKRENTANASVCEALNYPLDIERGLLSNPSFANLHTENNIINNSNSSSSTAVYFELFLVKIKRTCWTVRLHSLLKLSTWLPRGSLKKKNPSPTFDGT